MIRVICTSSIASSIVPCSGDSAATNLLSSCLRGSSLEIIEHFAESQNRNLTDFIREAIFSHMNNLIENVGIINLDKLIKELEKIEDSTKITFNSIEIIKNLFQEYGLTKINFSSKKGKNKFIQVEKT